MPELLLELFSEEIPARMQAQAAIDLSRLFEARIRETGLAFKGVRTFAGPRRLTLVADDLAGRQDDRVESRRGPRIGSPEAALEGFLRSAGAQRSDLIERDGAYHVERRAPGRSTLELLAEILPAIAQSFPWPKSMRSADSSFRWVRPLRGVLCVFDGSVVPIVLGGVQAGDQTFGHRFMGDDRSAITARSSEAYLEGLRQRFVIVSADERRGRILERARSLCAAEGLELVEDEGLLTELCGLAEWPTPVLGRMEARFLSLPPEVVRTSMRTHQKYFAVRTAGSAALAPRFVVVANLEPDDGGAALAAGNAKVLTARLSDADFFWREDQKLSLEGRLERLEGVVFHARLGSLRQRSGRLERLARVLAAGVSADAELCAAAGRLCKADLTTGMVGEFPELQGVMGGYYAQEEARRSWRSGEAVQFCGFEIADQAVLERFSAALGEHYRPLGPSDTLPKSTEGRVVALADKLDLLVSFFAIGEVPTGSKDPFALRRAALGAIRLIRAEGAPASVRVMVQAAAQSAEDGSGGGLPARAAIVEEVATFIFERLKVLLREEGRRHDIIDAAAAAAADDLVDLIRRVEILSDFVATDGGEALLAGLRRALNILKAEARKPAERPEATDPPTASARADPDADAHADVASEEAGLKAALATCRPEVEAALASGDFAFALRALSSLRGPIDAFFNAVLVNDPDPAKRAGRLTLLRQIRQLAVQVADFSLLSG